MNTDRRVENLPWQGIRQFACMPVACRSARFCQRLHAYMSSGMQCLCAARHFGDLSQRIAIFLIRGGCLRHVR